jgi:hypothetical protein
MSERAHPAGALASSSLGLDRPIVAADLARGVARRGASLLLLVPVLLATVATERVRLVAAFSLSLSSLRLRHHDHHLVRSQRAKKSRRSQRAFVLPAVTESIESLTIVTHLINNKS